MPNYSNGKIYKLVNSVDDKIYIGSTTQALSSRKSSHKRNTRKYPNRTVYAHFNTIGWSSVRIILIESFNCQNSEELRMREQHWIDLLRPELNRQAAYVHCPHGRRHNMCRECDGSSICEHSRIRSQCRDCDGSSICEHSRRRSRCADCGGIGICQHGRQRSQCGDCNASRYRCEFCCMTLSSKLALKRHKNSTKHITNFINF